MSNKAVFLDRDNTLIEDFGYINHPDQVKLLEDIDTALLELKRMGYKLVVVSNQSGVARGIVTEKALGEIHKRFKRLLAEKGIHLDRIYYCPYHPDGVVPKYRKESDWRKPNPGMLLAAADEMDIDLSQSWMLGNRVRDIEAGLRAGCKTILINRLSHQTTEPGAPKPDHKAVNMKEAVNIIKKYHRSSPEPAGQAQKNQAVPTLPPPQTAEQSVQTSPAEPKDTQQLSPPQPAVQTTSANHDILNMTAEQLLAAILEQLKRTQRADMFGEFSTMRLLAGIVQVIVLFCLLICVWLLLAPDRQDNAVFIALGFAVVLQVMALTFYIMQERK